MKSTNAIGAGLTSCSLPASAQKKRRASSTGRLNSSLGRRAETAARRARFPLRSNFSAPACSMSFAPNIRIRPPRTRRCPGLTGRMREPRKGSFSWNWPGLRPRRFSRARVSRFRRPTARASQTIARPAPKNWEAVEEPSSRITRTRTPGAVGNCPRQQIGAMNERFCVCIAPII